MKPPRVPLAKIVIDASGEHDPNGKGSRRPAHQKVIRGSAAMKAQPMYEIRIAGQLDDTTVAAFAGLEMTHHNQVTVIVGEFDQAALHGMLERIRSLGLDLLEARRVPAGSR